MEIIRVTMYVTQCLELGTGSIHDSVLLPLVKGQLPGRIPDQLPGRGRIGAQCSSPPQALSEQDR